ncbi:hypothetical protein DL96DRAFT_1809904 [Flagelloscypha sp. PMI_526]|nr:hypothetical protein DL96DRAFT_1809904 [Flagelloscypha sp. PMI_526]
MTSSRLSEFTAGAESDTQNLHLSLGSTNEGGGRNDVPFPTGLYSQNSFPADVIREVFRMSAQHDGITQARMLTLISYQVQQWIDPILFSTIRYDESQYHSIFRKDNSPDLIYHTGDSESLNRDFGIFLSSPRFSRINHLVSTLYINSPHPNSLSSVSSLLTTIPGLKNLFIEVWGSPLVWEAPSEPSDTTSPPTALAQTAQIQALHVNGSHLPLFPAIPNLSHTLTYLALYYPISYRTNPDVWRTTTSIPNLRILLIETTASWAPEIISASQDWLSALKAPSLELVLWKYPLMVWSWEILAQHIHHPKLLFVVTPSLSHTPTEIPPEKLWPFIPVPEGYFDEKNLWSFGHHSELVDQGLELLKARRDRQGRLGIM